jgi:hypothetical protein
VLLDRRADVAEMRAGVHGAYASPHRLVCHLDQPARLDRRLADEEHAARVAVIAVLDYRDVDVDDVAVLSLSPGMPWHTTWFTDVHSDAGYGECPGGA